MRLISQVKTANLFVGLESQSELMEDFSDFKWPPYYKVGTFDPFEDDPRLAIKCVEFCPLSRTLCIGGNGGQVVTFSFSPVPTEISLEVRPLLRGNSLTHVHAYRLSRLRFSGGKVPEVGEYEHWVQVSH